MKNPFLRIRSGFPSGRLCGGIQLFLLCLAWLLGTPGAGQAGTLVTSINCDPVQGSYLVQLAERRNAAAPAAQSLSLTQNYGGVVSHVYSTAFKGFSVTQLNSIQAQALASDPNVHIVEENCWGHIATTQFNAPWALDRVDQRDLPLSLTYSYNSTGQGVHVYIIDTGIRANHPELLGRVGSGGLFFGIPSSNNPTNTNDPCHGHGTHVAGIVAGTTYGVAKSAIVHPLVVANCNGASTKADAIAAVDWLTANRIQPAVANMSVAYGGSALLDLAVKNSIASGIPFAVGSGNSASNQTCVSFSPARVPEALTVGASTISDIRPTFSNHGPCVDLHAPGVAVLSACPAELTTFCQIGCLPMGGNTSLCDGTSMASPHVAGTIARHRQQFPLDSPAAIHQAIVAKATQGRLANVGSSPNRLLFTRYLDNLPPVAGIDWVSTAWETPKTIPFSLLLANDQDPDNDPLAVCGFGQPTHGTLSQNLSNLIYQPAQGCAVGSDTFEYRLCDGIEEVIGVVNIEIGGVVCPGGPTS